MAGLRAWIMDRAGITPEMVKSWNRGLPKGVGWLSTLGPVAMALLLLQSVTGIFLSMHYSPHPDGAYESMTYLRSLPMGKLVHSLHYWGDSALIIVVVVHMVHTYLIGAYKKPRELNWLLGIVLLQLVLAFGFTGYILPWDMKAYYATQVRASIVGGMPFIGPYAAQLIKGGPDIGAMTLTRLYAIHSLLLPALVLPFVLAHWTVSHRKGSTQPGARVDEPTPAVSRYLDHQLFKISVATLGMFAVVYLLSTLHPAELEFKANPADPTYHPRPEWYFLFLFQFVADWGSLPGLGKLSWIPVLAVPGSAMAWLALAPWIDRGPERRLSKRPIMGVILGIGIAGAAFFTFRAYSLLHPNATPENSLRAAYTDKGERELDPVQVEAGRKAFGQCGGCHVAYGDYTAGKSGPDLSGEGLKTILAQVEGHPNAHELSFKDRFQQYVRGTLRPPKTQMPTYPDTALTQQDLENIGAYLSQDPLKATVEHKDPSHPK